MSTSGDKITLKLVSKRFGAGSVFFLIFDQSYVTWMSRPTNQNLTFLGNCGGLGSLESKSSINTYYYENHRIMKGLFQPDSVFKIFKLIKKPFFSDSERNRKTSVPEPFSGGHQRDQPAQRRTRRAAPEHRLRVFARRIRKRWVCSRRQKKSCQVKVVTLGVSAQRRGSVRASHPAAPGTNPGSVHIFHLNIA